MNEPIRRLFKEDFYTKNENGKVSWKLSFEALFKYVARKQSSLVYIQKIHEFLYLWRNVKRYPSWYKNPKNSSRLFLLKEYVELQLMKRYSSLRRDKIKRVVK